MIFDLEDTIISPKYNELERSSKLTKRQFFENQMLDYTIIAHESLKSSVILSTRQMIVKWKNALAFEVKNDKKQTS